MFFFLFADHRAIHSWRRRVPRLGARVLSGRANHKRTADQKQSRQKERNVWQSHCTQGFCLQKACKSGASNCWNKNCSGPLSASRSFTFLFEGSVSGSGGFTLASQSLLISVWHVPHIRRRRHTGNVMLRSWTPGEPQKLWSCHRQSYSIRFKHNLDFNNSRTQRTGIWVRQNHVQLNKTSFDEPTGFEGHFGTSNNWAAWMVKPNAITWHILGTFVVQWSISYVLGPK